MSLRVSKPEFNIREKLNELDRPIGVQGNNILQSNTTAESFSKIQAGRKNILINGNMSIAQRGTSTTSITTDTFGACDRWELDLSTAGTWTMEQVGDAPYNTGFTHCSSLTCTASNALSSGANFVQLRQKIEAYNIKGLRGGNPNAKPLTASFWVKSNEPGKYYVRLSRVRTGKNTNFVSISYTIEQSEVWEFKTITFPPDTQDGYRTDENAEALVIYFTLGMNQNSYGSAHYGIWHNNPAFTGRGQTNLAAANGNYWRMTGAQLEIGSEHTEFEHRPFQEDLELCQRYFQKISAYSDMVCVGPGRSNGTTNAPFTVPLATPLRASPVLNACSWAVFTPHTQTNSASQTPSVLKWEANSSVLTCELGSLSGMTNGRSLTVFLNGNNEVFKMDAEM